MKLLVLLLSTTSIFGFAAALPGPNSQVVGRQAIGDNAQDLVKRITGCAGGYCVVADSKGNCVKVLFLEETA